MKRTVAIFIILALLLTGCGKKTEWTALDIASVIVESQDTDLIIRSALSGSEAFTSILSDSYGIDENAFTDGAVLAAGGTYAFEVAVLKLANGVSSSDIESAFEGYIKERIHDFTGYFPQQELIVKKAEVLVKNGYILLLICPDISAAEQAFDRVFDSDPPKDKTEYIPMEENGGEGRGDDESDGWEYDHDALVKAFNTGYTESLHKKDEAILDVCINVLNYARESSSSIPELELRIHDWLVDNMEYDTGELERYGGTPDPDNDNPYGALVKGKGICEGYTRTFQLLMDLAGIECISVYGNSDNGMEYGEHAWNQVCLDGEWYIVDVTWDDPLYSGTGSLPASYHHRYFNVTSDAIRNNHFWDESEVPEAAGIKYTWDAVLKGNDPKHPGH